MCTAIYSTAFFSLYTFWYNLFVSRETKACPAHPELLECLFIIIKVVHPNWGNSAISLTVKADNAYSYFVAASLALELLHP